MRSICFLALPLLLVTMLSRAQITGAPEFREDGKFQRGAAAALDGTSHVSALRPAINEELVARLRALPGYAEGVRLIESRLLGPAEEYFRKKGQRIGLAVTQFLSGKDETSAELLCKLAAENPNDKALLPFLGETVGVSKAWTAPMLAALRRMATPPTADSQYYLARALLKQDPPVTAEALTHLELSASLDPQSTRALLELARQATAADRRPDAIAALEEALRRDDTLTAAHYRLAQLYRASGETERSAVHLRKYRELQ